jgi:hypothetical protein
MKLRAVCLTLAIARCYKSSNSICIPWGRSAVGSAPRWHRGGRGFEPRRLHHFFFSSVSDCPDGEISSKARSCSRSLFLNNGVFVGIRGSSCWHVPLEPFWTAGSRPRRNRRLSLRTSRRLGYGNRRRSGVVVVDLASRLAKAITSPGKMTYGDEGRSRSLGIMGGAHPLPMVSMGCARFGSFAASTFGTYPRV